MVVPSLRIEATRGLSLSLLDLKHERQPWPIKIVPGSPRPLNLKDMGKKVKEHMFKNKTIRAIPIADTIYRVLTV